MTQTQIQECPTLQRPRNDHCDGHTHCSFCLSIWFSAYRPLFHAGFSATTASFKQNTLSHLTPHACGLHMAKYTKLSLCSLDGNTERMHLTTLNKYAWATSILLLWLTRLAFWIHNPIWANANGPRFSWYLPFNRGRLPIHKPQLNSF